MKGLESLATFPVIVCLQSRQNSQLCLLEGNLYISADAAANVNESPFVKQKGKQTNYNIQQKSDG